MKSSKEIERGGSIREGRTLILEEKNVILEKLGLFGRLDDPVFCVDLRVQVLV